MRSHMFPMLRGAARPPFPRVQYPYDDRGESTGRAGGTHGWPDALGKRPNVTAIISTNEALMQSLMALKSAPFGARPSNLSAFHCICTASKTFSGWLRSHAAKLMWRAET
eukprot:scaffold316250_cov33-Tisochrysis_lutea.AAC.1